MKLYSTGCPKCKVLKTKLEQKGIDYELIEDQDEVREFADKNNVREMPLLIDGDKIMNFVEANRYIASL